MRIYLICFALLSCFYAFSQSDTTHQVVRFLVDKKGNETGEVDTLPAYCKCPSCGFNGDINKKPFLGKRITYYDGCTGKWMKIEYYFLGIRTRIQRNPAFEGERN